MFLTKNNEIKWQLLGIAFAVTVALCLVGVFWFDKSVYLFLRGYDCPAWRIFDTLFATKVWLFGSFVAWMLILVSIYIKTRVRNKVSGFKFNPKQSIKWVIEKSKNNPACLIFCSVFSAAVATGILKILIGRARPIFFEALGQSGFYPGHADWAFNSMPSGHTSASFAAFVMIGLLFPKIKGATWTFAIVIGASRVCHGMHWPSDVLLGAFIGMVAADLVKWFMNKKIK